MIILIFPVFYIYFGLILKFYFILQTLISFNFSLFCYASSIKIAISSILTLAPATERLKVVRNPFILIILEITFLYRIMRLRNPVTI